MIKKLQVIHKAAGVAILKYNEESEMLTIGGNKKFLPLFQTISEAFTKEKVKFINNQKNKKITILKVSVKKFKESIDFLKKDEYINIEEIFKLGRELN